jgi:hypothetical protein
MSYVETQVVPLLDTSKLAGAVTVILPAVGFKFSAVSEKVCAEELVPVVTLPNASEEGVGVTDGGGVQRNVKPFAGVIVLLRLHVAELNVPAVVADQSDVVVLLLKSAPVAPTIPT